MHTSRQQTGEINEKCQNIVNMSVTTPRPHVARVHSTRQSCLQQGEDWVRADQSEASIAAVDQSVIRDNECRIINNNPSAAHQPQPRDREKKEDKHQVD